MTSSQVILDIQIKYGEWLEMAGENSYLLLNEILAQLIIKEREKNAYYEKRLEKYDHIGGKR